MGYQTGLFETIKLHHGKFLLMEEHTNRLTRACQTLYGVDCREEVSEALRLCAKRFAIGQFTAKIVWSPRDGLSWHISPPPASIDRLDAHVASKPIGNSRSTYGYKWIDRSHYPACLSPEQDWILYDSEGYCTEFTRGNLAYLEQQQWYTPPSHMNLLPGTLRDYLLRVGILQERQLHLETLLNHHPPLLFYNSLRGFIPAKLVY